MNRSQISKLFGFLLLCLCLIFSPTVLAQEETDSEVPETPSGLLHYRVLQGESWSGESYDNAQLGGSVISGISIGVSDELSQKGGLRFKAFLSNAWTDWVGNNSEIGGPGHNIQALRIELSGQLQYLYNVYYRVHMDGVGWSGWARNTEPAGSEGYNRPITIVQITLTNKGDLPGQEQIGNSFTQGSFIWPVPNYHNIISRFGPRNGNHHDGFDIPAPSGHPILSVKAGTVVLSGNYGNFGNIVVVENDSGELVYYAHMSQTQATVGQKVGPGQQIGLIGATGNALGPHLHMEVYDPGDNNVNPENYY